ncbi:hypothetical protein GCM10022393_04380 [Aquimarina addita]|uniref:Peptidase S8/S53 domain-containing protein n=1 Tax=Aquimarina addita TaxID=870485 RepID=A0ABP7XAR9_9FLAO
MKKITTLCLGLLIILSCSKEDVTENENLSADSQKMLTVEEINEFIAGELKVSGDVNWTDASALMLYSAVMQSNGVLTIGYGGEGESFTEGQRSSVSNTALRSISEILAKTEGVNKSTDDIAADDILNFAEVEITNLATVEELKDLDNIRYFQPNYGLYLQEENNGSQKDAGCAQESQTINSNDYRVISPNARLPWNFDIHNIPDAWSYSTGAGITVGLIDTGLSASQNLLGSGFNDGDSNGRTVERFGTFIDSPWWWSNSTDGPNDKCGHGTQMASVLASPRNNDYMPVGVAYNCNLVAYRGTEDVLLNDYHEKKGVTNALKALGNRGDVKIISMSVGYPWSIGNVKDAVEYAYGKGKMIVAAGGTSTTFTNWYGVIFPASMNETVAVTGLKDNGYNRCDICHEGSKIDFTMVMQRASNTDRNVPVLGFNSGTQAYVGGSSVATAATAGIAALVWARNPGMTRAQVLNKLKQAGEFYPNRNSNFGYGNIDALKAVQ